MTEDGTDPRCIFCAIVRGDAEASVVYGDDATLAFMDIRPIQPGHTLVIPRRHAPLLRDLDDALAGRLWASMMTVYRALRQSLPMDGLNVVVADGTAAGQEVAHAHVHLIPRASGDGFGFRFPPGFGSMPPRRDLDEIASRIRDALPETGDGVTADVSAG